MNHSRTFMMAALGLVLIVTACGGPAEEAPAPAPGPETAAAPPAATGGVTGTVTYANGDPDKAIKMDADPVCAGLHAEPSQTEKVVTDGAGNLANVFVYVKEGLAPGAHKPAAEPHLLDQKGCLYSPHVSGVMVGQKLVIRNSDPTLHNVHALPTKNKEFNQGQPFQDMELEHVFDQPEVMVRFKCDVHPWMSSYMGVLEHPFFGVSGADGSFSIQNLPAGTYTLEAWHEEFGTRTQQVTVGADETAQVTFDFSPAA